MRNLLDEPRRCLATRPPMTDYKGREIFAAAQSSVTDSESAVRLFATASEHRFGGPYKQQRAAYEYLALAFRMIDDPTISVQFDDQRFVAPQIFTFAGHSFFQISQIGRSADAYWRAGVASAIGAQTDLATRAFARAKSCYGAIGDGKRVDAMHVLECETRRLQGQGLGVALWTWRVTSCYGTSLGQWLLSVLILLAVFTLGYEGLHAGGWIHSQHCWIPVLTPAYYCVVTSATVGYGDIAPSHPASQVVVTVNVLLAYVLLAVGATILGRKVVAP